MSLLESIFKNLDPALFNFTHSASHHIQEMFSKLETIIENESNRADSELQETPQSHNLSNQIYQKLVHQMMETISNQNQEIETSKNKMNAMHQSLELTNVEYEKSLRAYLAWVRATLHAHMQVLLKKPSTIRLLRLFSR